MSKQYCYSFDGDYYTSDLFDTKEEAIQAAREEAKEMKENLSIFYLGVANKYEENCGGLANSVAEILNESAWDKVGEFSEGYMELTNEQEKILEERLKKVVLDFQKEFNHEPSFYTISDVEVINL